MRIASILPILVTSQCLAAGVSGTPAAAAAEIGAAMQWTGPSPELDAPLPPQLSLPASFGLCRALACDVEQRTSRENRGSLVREWLPPLLLAGALATVQLAVEPPVKARWNSHNRFDDWIRGGLRADTRRGRRAAGRASDAGLVALGAGLLVDWYWLRHEYPIADSFRVDSTWLLADAVVTQGIKLGAARERPFVARCLDDPHYDTDCSDITKRNDSFFSGHASTSAAIAGLLCARHLHRPERDRSDALVCAAAAGGGVATGVLRIVADKHYTIDVVSGWVSGAVFGYLLPAHFHYTPGEQGPFTWKAFSPLVEPRLVGIEYGFRF